MNNAGYEEIPGTGNPPLEISWVFNNRDGYCRLVDHADGWKDVKISKQALPHVIEFLQKIQQEMKNAEQEKVPPSGSTGRVEGENRPRPMGEMP